MRAAARAERRVVVTGLGLVTPLATGVSLSWERLLRGETAVARCSRVDPERLARLPCQIAAEVAHGTGEGEFDLERWVPPELRRHTRPFIHYALAAGEQALADAGWSQATAGERRCERAGVCVGTGMVDLEAVMEAGTRLSASYRKLSPFFIPSILGNMPAGHLSIRHGLRGPNHAPTTACTTGAHAIGDAANLIRLGHADMMLAGATEASIHELALAGFGRAQALATGFNGGGGGDDDGSPQRPEEASRPFSAGRTGFVMGEGAGMMVLEDYDAAIARGVDPTTGIYAELRGYGSSADGYHITSPAPDGSGAVRAMRAALEFGGWEAEDVDYVNAHATSTPMGDGLECAAIASVFGGSGGGGGGGGGERRCRPVAVSSTKGAVGHLLGAAGAVEAIFTVLAVKDQRCPPTVNLTEAGLQPELRQYHPDALNLLMQQQQQREQGEQGEGEGEQAAMEVRGAMTNSFGFGGTNASLLFTPMASD
jgi:3-oxoacyl-[acyl-carrier-protein] synthase II